MDFLLQTIDGQLEHDFTFHLRKACKHQNWFHRKEVFDWICTDAKKEYPSGYVPVGTVEFVTDYLKQHIGSAPDPKNIPDQLNQNKFTKRMVNIKTADEIDQEYFVKSIDTIKGYSDFTDSPPAGQYQVSEIIEIDSEYRGFVHKNELVGLCNYAGEFDIFPDVDHMRKMIESYKSEAPPAYTLDVGVGPRGTFIIEVHDFFACGLYGFTDPSHLPYMFGDWYRYYTEQSNEK